MSHLGIENTAFVKPHRTPTSIRAYLLDFSLYLSHYYVPSNFYKLDESSSRMILGFFMPLSIVSTFYINLAFQCAEQLENPFDQVALMI